VVTSVDGDTFQGTVKVKLGPIALVYNGTGTFVEKDEAAGRMVIDAKGKDKRGNGTAGAHVTATMTQEGTSTRVEVLTDLNITGKPAQFGRGVMQDVSDKLLGQFTSCLENKVGASPDPVAAAPAPAGGEAPISEKAAPADNVRDLGSSSSARPAPAPAQAPAPKPSTSNDDALDLGATVLPVLIKGYWREGLIGLLGFLLLVRVLRRK
jgi:carbon monoxide dehydrogenase subunit G